MDSIDIRIGRSLMKAFPDPFMLIYKGQPVKKYISLGWSYNYYSKSILIPENDSVLTELCVDKSEHIKLNIYSVPKPKNMFYTLPNWCKHNNNDYYLIIKQHVILDYSDCEEKSFCVTLNIKFLYNICSYYVFKVTLVVDNCDDTQEWKFVYESKTKSIKWSLSNIQLKKVNKYLIYIDIDRINRFLLGII